MPTISQCLKAVRTSRHLSVSDLARSCGCTPGYVYKVEKGHAPSPAFLRKVSVVLDLDLGELMQQALQEHRERVVGKVEARYKSGGRTG